MLPPDVPIDNRAPGPLIDGEIRRYIDDGKLWTIEKHNGVTFTTHSGDSGSDSPDIADTFSNFEFSEASFSSGFVTFSADDDAIIVKDDNGKNRAIFGRITTNQYGLQVNNAAENEIFGIYGGIANMAGWQISSSEIQKTESGSKISLTTAVNPRLEIVKNNVTTLKVGMLDSSNAGIKIVNAAGNATLMEVDNNATAQIGGWNFTADMFRSANTGRRIELNSSDMRISIYEETGDTKVAMGFLTNLVRGNGSGTATGGSVIYIRDSTKDWNIEQNSGAGEFKDLSVEVDLLDNNFASGTQTKVITTNTATQINAGTFSSTTNGHKYRVKYPSDSYGFWAKQGDTLAIDGDVTYDSGDWLIQNNAAVRILDGDGDEIIRLGTISAAKGLFIGGDLINDPPLAQYTGTQILIGNESAGEYLKYTTAGGLVVAGTITVESVPELETIWQEVFTGDTNIGGTYTNVGDYISSNYLINPVVTIGGGTAANTTAVQKLVVSADATMGNMVFQAGDDGSGNDESWIVSKSFIPFDKEATYKMTIRMRDTGTSSGYVYVGVQQYNADKNPIRIDGNTTASLLYSGQCYFVALGLDTPSDWVIREGYLKGVGSSLGDASDGTTSLTDLATVHQNTAFIAPLLITNYNDQSGSHEVDYMILEKLGGGSAHHRTVIDGGKITTGKIQSSDEKTYFDLDNDIILMTEGSTPRVAIGNTDNAGDYAIKVSSATYNVTTAVDDQLMFSSNWAIPKYTSLFTGNNENSTGSGLLDINYTEDNGTATVTNAAGTLLTDGEKTWEPGALVGGTVIRTNAGTGGSPTWMRAQGLITANTSTTITHVALTGGYPGSGYSNGNQWYAVSGSGPASTYIVVPKPWGKYTEGDSYYVGTKKMYSGYTSTGSWTTDSQGTTIATIPYLHDRNNTYIRLSAFLTAKTHLRLGIYRYTWNDNPTNKRLQLELTGVRDLGRFKYTPMSTSLIRGDVVWTDDLSNSTGGSFGEPAWFVVTQNLPTANAAHFGGTAELRVGLDNGTTSNYFDEIYNQFPFVKLLNSHSLNGEYMVATMNLNGHLTSTYKLKHGDLYIIRLTGGRTTASEDSGDTNHCVIQPQVTVHGYNFNASGGNNST